MHKSSRAKVLITSVGSLVAQNILDALDNRRTFMEIAGTNTGAQHPRVFRTDVLYRIPPAGDKEECIGKLLEILALENPDIVLAGRDEDAVLLCEIKERYPKFAPVIPSGNAGVARMMLDKLESAFFCREHGLPFADTMLLNGQQSQLLNDFVEKHGFPLIAKWRAGFGSRGVYFVTSFEDCQRLSHTGTYILQEYLDPLDNLQDFFDAYRTGIPLFFEIPENKQYASQMILGPNESSEVFVSVNQMRLGRCEYSAPLECPELVRLTLHCASELRKAGWMGMLNIQWKPDRNGVWKITEFNPRMTGSTSARNHLGFDEFGLLCHLFFPHLNVPVERNHRGIPGYVERSLTDSFVSLTQIDEFNRNGVWKKS